MIKIKLQGGLGNQMFQLAFGMALQEINHEKLVLDATFLLDRSPSENLVYRDYDLDIFPVDVPVYNTAKWTLKDQYYARLNGVKTLIEEKGFAFDKGLLRKAPGIYANGFFQSYKYFENLAEQIRKTFVVREQFQLEESMNLLSEIRHSNAVCLNVRRADFVHNEKAARFHGFCGMDYLQRGMDYLQSRNSELRYFVFSDDIAWCRDHFPKLGNISFVDHDHAGHKFANYLYLMSNCKYFVIPNSTFGWWAAWLSKASEKIVVSPKQWFAEKETNAQTGDLIPENWIRL